MATRNGTIRRGRGAHRGGGSLHNILGGRSTTDGSGSPYTEEELNLNVRRALNELRYDLKLPPELGGAGACGEDSKLGQGNTSEGSAPTADAGTCTTRLGGLLSSPKTPSPTSNHIPEISTWASSPLTSPSNPPPLHLHSRQSTNTDAEEIASLVSQLLSPSLSNATINTSSSCARNWESISTAQRRRLTLSTDVSCRSGFGEECESSGLGGWRRETPSALERWVRMTRDNCRHHTRFYFPDGTLTFRVEDTMYNIHRHFFEHYSSFFLTIFNSLKSESTILRGSTSSLDDTSSVQFQSPIYLPDVTTTDFDRLLSIIYPSTFARCDITTREEWISVLSLSSLLEFSSIRELAIENLSSVASIIDKAILGKKYGVKSWLLSAYSELCTREKPLTLEEGRRLGVDLVVRINELRHELFFGAGVGGAGHSRAMNGLNSESDGSSSCRSSVYGSIGGLGFEEVPERVVQHFGLRVMDDGVPEAEGVYFKKVLDANQ